MRLRLCLAILTAASVLAAGDDYSKAAVQAARWIDSTALPRHTGLAWPSDPADPKSVDTQLYGGTPGIVLFFLELYRDTGDRQYLDRARMGADYLAANLASQDAAGLYEGIAGVGYTLIEVYRAAHDEKYREAAVACVRRVQVLAKKAGAGVEWGDSVDIISGGAGVGLFLLYAARELKDPSAVETAVQAGKRLIETGRRVNGGLKWMLNEKREMPNFSHGTAGISYFLAALYRETKQKPFLDAALAGGKYLLSIANIEDGRCLIYHADPDGLHRYYLGWCHGPPGTARTFYILYQITGDKQWLEWTTCSMSSLLASGIPEKRTDGFWNNVGWCCGSASVAQFALDMYRITKDREYLDFAKRVTADLLSRATKEGGGLKWIQAETRVKPDVLFAQTGLMQGAAGIGLWLAHLDEFEHGKKPAIVLPDSPFVSQ